MADAKNAKTTPIPLLCHISHHLSHHAIKKPQLPEQPQSTGLSSESPTSRHQRLDLRPSPKSRIPYQTSHASQGRVLVIGAYRAVPLKGPDYRKSNSELFSLVLEIHRSLLQGIVSREVIVHRSDTATSLPRTTPDPSSWMGRMGPILAGSALLERVGKGNNGVARCF
jgi:hypothetical protein